MDTPTMKRRTFLKLSLGASSLMFGFRLALAEEAADNTAMPDSGLQTFQPNAWVKVDNNNHITLMIDKSEMGQGILTALAMLLAEELEVDMNVVRTEFAPADPVYSNSLIGVQVTGGSTGIPSSWDNLRHMGAAARTLFIQAAARRWQVPVQECLARHGQVQHTASERRSNYGELITAAAQESLPDEIRLKDPEEFRIIGKPVPRLDTPLKVDGSAVFGIDVKLDGLVNATIKHPPVFGAKVDNIDDTASRSAQGVIDIFAIPSGVVVVADTFWHAKKAADLLRITWTRPQATVPDSEALRRSWFGLSREEGSNLRSEGAVEEILEENKDTLTAVYELPYQAHATMEPMNCTIDLKPDRCDVWVGTQGQGTSQETVVALTGLDYDQVYIHTTYLGGGFGRRGEVDFVAEAVQIAQRVKRPVKLLWTREEDMQHDFYRPASYHVLSGAVKDGKPAAWTHRLVGSSIMQRIAPDFVPAAMPRWVPRSLKSFASWVTGGVIGMVKDNTLSEGAADLPYAIPNIEVEAVTYDPGVPIGFWRSVGHSSNAFVVESFIDELAHRAQADPYRFRRQLLGDHPRRLGVLDLAAEKAGWGKSLPDGRGMGIAVHKSFNSYAAQVAEVEVDARGGIRVHRVVCAVDCGIVVNPDTVAAQIEGAIVYGLSAALKGAVTLKDGRVQQSNFHNFQVLRMNEMPQVEVYIVPSLEPPTGIGEPGLPVIAPAVANAIFAATGKRLRRLPIRPQDLA
jgi:isoquinoline 1-oxidoreductase beta subunit